MYMYIEHKIHQNRILTIRHHSQGFFALGFPLRVAERGPHAKGMFLAACVFSCSRTLDPAALACQRLECKRGQGLAGAIWVQRSYSVLRHGSSRKRR